MVPRKCPRLGRRFGGRGVLFRFGVGWVVWGSGAGVVELLGRLLTFKRGLGTPKGWQSLAVGVSPRLREQTRLLNPEGVTFLLAVAAGTCSVNQSRLRG